MTISQQIRAAHAAATAALRDGLASARRCGDLLIDAKAALPHGEWLPWLAEHCDLSVRMAQGYMRIARRWPQLKVAATNTKRVSHLPFRQALALLAESKSPDEEPQASVASSADAFDALCDVFNALCDEAEADAGRRGTSINLRLHHTDHSRGAYSAPQKERLKLP